MKSRAVQDTIQLRLDVGRRWLSGRNQAHRRVGRSFVASMPPVPVRPVDRGRRDRLNIDERPRWRKPADVDDICVTLRPPSLWLIWPSAPDRETRMLQHVATCSHLLPDRRQRDDCPDVAAILTGGGVHGVKDRRRRGSVPGARAGDPSAVCSRPEVPGDLRGLQRRTGGASTLGGGRTCRRREGGGLPPDTGRTRGRDPRDPRRPASEPPHPDEG